MHSHSNSTDLNDVKEHYRRLAPHYAAQANWTCERIYHRLVRRFLAGRRRVIEMGSGCSDLIDNLDTESAVACDLSLDMLRGRTPRAGVLRVAAAGEHLPLPDACSDALFSINVLEHIIDLRRVLFESVRVLEPGGLWLAVTPNGNWESLLDLAERWSLKIPEGPHAFLTTKQLAQAVSRDFEVIEHRTMLVLPVGPPALAAVIDRLTASSFLGWGFFQYIVARKPHRP